MDKASIAEILDDIAALLELKGENPFKVRAYQAGARALESLNEDLAVVIAEGRLGKVKGIGQALEDKITTLFEEDRLPYYEELRASVPAGLVEMLEIPGLGPKKIRKLHQELGIDSIAALQKACEEGRVESLEGFGAKTQQKLLEGIRNREAYGRRHLWWDAFEVAEPLLAGLRQLPEVLRAEHAGSLRRKRETVGDLDFIVASDNPGPIMDWFTTRPQVMEVTAKGETKASVRLEGGLQADLRVVPEAQFHFALHHFTGSKEHNVRMRQRALERGLSLSEWGLGPKDESGKMDRAHSLKVTSEEELFQLLGLSYIPPELREDQGEIEAAEQNAIPRLVEYGDIRGCFHNHTNASDGHSTLEEMVAAAEGKGWEYLGIADHSKASFQAHGLDEGRLLEQIQAIKALNDSGKYRCHVFCGSEVDILKDGSLDFGDDILRQLDYVVASVHNAFSLSEEAMTARIIKALENPYVTMLGHPTGRLLLRREGYPVNLGKVVDAAIANGKIIELNANPWRLDMDWRYWRKAAERGLLCAINPDAHRVEGLDHMEAGVNIARKGWLTPEMILNCRPLEDVRRYFRSRQS